MRISLAALDHLYAWVLAQDLDPSWFHPLFVSFYAEAADPRARTMQQNMKWCTVAQSLRTLNKTTDPETVLATWRHQTAGIDALFVGVYDLIESLVRRRARVKAERLERNPDASWEVSLWQRLSV